MKDILAANPQLDVTTRQRKRVVRTNSTTDIVVTDLKRSLNLSAAMANMFKKNPATAFLASEISVELAKDGLLYDKVEIAGAVRFLFRKGNLLRMIISTQEHKARGLHANTLYKYHWNNQGPASFKPMVRKVRIDDITTASTVA